MTRALAITGADLGAALDSIRRQAAAPASSPGAIAIITASPAARAIAERAVVEPDGRGGWIASEPDDDPEYGTVGRGRTREAAIADLIEASDLDFSPDPTPEQIAADRARFGADEPELCGEDEWPDTCTGRERDVFTGGVEEDVE